MIKKTLLAAIRILTARCEDHARLRSKSLDTPLTFTEQLTRMGHWLACGSCRRFSKQIKQLELAARQLPDPPVETLSPAARDRIAAKIEGFSGSGDTRNG